jgi:hypothetical protein
VHARKPLPRSTLSRPSDMLRARHLLLLRASCTAGRLPWTAAAKRVMCWWNKEVRFFSRGAAAGVDICWYRDRYSCPPAAGPGGVSERAVFDGSPDYFVLPDASIARMARSLGVDRVRIVALLRNPADRFYSAYNMGMSEYKQRRSSKSDASYTEFAGERKRAAVDAVAAPSTLSVHTPPLAFRLPRTDSLERWIACAPDCPSEPNVVSMFFTYGMYAVHLAKYFRHFGRERVLVLKSEDFYSDSWSTRAALCVAGCAARLRRLGTARRRGCGAAQFWGRVGEKLLGQTEAARASIAAALLRAAQPTAL